MITPGLVEVTEAPRTKPALHPNKGQKVTSSWDPLSQSCAAQLSDPWAPRDSATTCLMDSLPDVFCYVPGIPFSTGSHVCAESHWHPWVWISMRDTDKNMQPSSNRYRKHPACHQCWAIFCFCKGAGQPCKSDHCRTEWKAE